MNLDNKLQDVHAKYWEGERAACNGKTVIVVEGDDDRKILGSIFEQRGRTWLVHIRIVVAGGRSRVIDLIKPKNLFPDGWGLVDRDTWTDAEIERHHQQNPRLHVTQGWCLENIFLHPDLLRQVDRDVATRLSEQREIWVRAGALWWVLQRTREAQQRWQETLGWSYGSPRDDLKFNSVKDLKASLAQRVPEAIRNEAKLDLDDVAFRYERRIEELLALPEQMQWQRGVHGKCAYRRLLTPAFQVSGRQQDWREALLREVSRPYPPPLDALMAMLVPTVPRRPAASGSDPAARK